MIKGILFDYGGTIDTNGLHWGSVLWDHYQKYHVPVVREEFSKAYSFGERALAINPIVKPAHNFYDVLCLKIDQQFTFLESLGKSLDRSLVTTIASDCNFFVKQTIENVLPVLSALADQYAMVMVSNFYGNLNTVLSDFGLRHYFTDVIESAVVGVRKPDPEIYRLGVERLGMRASDCVVVGDSYSKDMIPGNTIGCKTIWLNVAGWEDILKTETTSVADLEITDFAQLTVQRIGLL